MCMRVLTISNLISLTHSLSIVEKNPTKFKIDNKELSSRRNFIDDAREEVKSMKDRMNLNRNRDRDRTARQPLLENLTSPPRAMSHGQTKYSKLENEIDSPSRQFLDDTMLQQRRMFSEQDEQLEIIGDSVGTLKTVSRQIGNELDEQAVMLDDFGYELESVDSKLNSTMSKMAKVLRLSNGTTPNYTLDPMSRLQEFNFMFDFRSPTVDGHRSADRSSHYYNYIIHCTIMPEKEDARQM
ncbi:hypothetical protein RUM43_002800 [Polyplax serrata]|uniref:t-SNARE coiled-coil homology domain-containing protein n=1 Tax=Polyplax serrata TaxID=468196 RepID=A0AAN8PZZ3_POLSC